MSPKSIFEAFIILSLVSAILAAIVLGSMATAKFARELQQIRRGASMSVQLVEPAGLRVSK